MHKNAVFGFDGHPPVIVSRGKTHQGLESSVSLVATESGETLIHKQKLPSRHQNYMFEAHVLGLLSDVGAAVPSVIYASEDDLYLSIIKGSSLDDNPGAFTAEVASSVSVELAKYRSLSFSGFGFPSLSADFSGSHKTWREFLSDATSSLDGILGYIGVDEAVIVRNFWEEKLPEIELARASLVHGDFSLDSIFVDGSAFSGVIDFGDSFLGDPLMDLAYFRFKEINKPYGASHHRLLVDDYPYDTPEDVVVFYMLFWAARRIVDCPNPAPFVNKFRFLAKLICSRQ